MRAPACRLGPASRTRAWLRRLGQTGAQRGVGERPDAPALVRHDGQWFILWGERSDRLEVVLEGQGAGVWPRSVSLTVWFGVVGSAAMIVVWALLCALPLALSHDLGGPLGLVALASMMAVSLRRERAFTFGFLCGFFEVSLTMWGASGYTVMIPMTLALQGGLARGALAWAVSLRSGPVLPLSVLVVGQGLRTTSVLTLPLSCGHDLAAWWWLGLPVAWGGGALLTAICGGVSYALVEPAFRRRGAVLLLVLIVITGAHELLRPVQGEPIPLKASVIQGGLPNWVYRQASVDPDAAQLINARYLEVAARERPGRLLILPETAVRETWGSGPRTRLPCAAWAW